MKTRDRISVFVSLAIGFLALLVLLPCTVLAAVSGQQEKTDVAGKFYEFDKGSHYEVQANSKPMATNISNTYGSFRIEGNIAAVENKAGVPAYKISEGNLSFFYNYSDTTLNADEDSWHLVDDKTNKVTDMKLDSDIMKGAIIIQTSKDQKTWITADYICNAFSDTPIRTNSIYSTTDVEMLNGCYYRVIIAYKLGIRTENSNILFINTDKYDYKKCAEVYEFYAYSQNSTDTSADLDQVYSLGSKVRADHFDGYFGQAVMDKSDIHYGWDLGNFFVSGYTDEVTDSDGNMVFLKNVGDRVTLWFRLNQNINRLNGKENLEITADTEGYDQYFETPKMDFGRGTLIVRYTDYNNVKADPVIYTNYLEANASVGADTKVQLFEEGDYEVALDYEVTSDEFIDKVGHYRIFFKFSVRNGNCMVYPFDVLTGSELTQSSMTENGFRLDLAQSRYLKINLKREVLKDSADGLVEDTRFNGPAKDGAQYTDEGIYTVTVSNKYTGQFTTKKIYVGTNNILRAHMATGLSIPEINSLVADGAKISDDGTIQLASVMPTGATQTTSEAEATNAPSSDSMLPDQQNSQDDNNNLIPTSVIGITLLAVFIVVLIIVIAVRKKHRSSKTETQSTGGDAQ